MSMFDCPTKEVPCEKGSAFKLKKGKWTQAGKWTGVCAELVVFEVRVTRGGNATVHWRRGSGRSRTEGSFQERIDYNIYPGTRYEKIELMAERDVEIEIRLRSRVALLESRRSRRRKK